MYESFERRLKKFFHFKRFMCIFLIGILFSGLTFTIIFTLENGWQKASYYSEEKYQALEEEARKIASDEGLLSKYNNNSLDIKADSFEITLKSSDEEAVIKLNVEDFGKDNQRNSISRDFKSKYHKITIYIIATILTIGSYALIDVVVIYIILSITFAITWLFHKIISILKRKK